jgi:hypothetical protein
LLAISTGIFRMRRLASALLLSTFALGAVATATGTRHGVDACNQNAARKQLAGESLKLFLKGCLAGRGERSTAQQQRMKACSSDATTKQLKGDARRSFMKQCQAEGSTSPS